MTYWIFRYPFAANDSLVCNIDGHGSYSLRINFVLKRISKTKARVHSLADLQKGYKYIDKTFYDKENDISVPLDTNEMNKKAFIILIRNLKVSLLPLTLHNQRKNLASKST